MNFKIHVTKTKKSRLNGIDFENLPFGKTISDHMFIADYENGEWKNFRIEPYGKMPFSPAMAAIHYGQAIFEGMKAFRNKDNQPILFRPKEHLERLNASAYRMCMPSFPYEVFQDALDKLIALDEQWIPNKTDSALYVRPVMFATDEVFGVRPSSTYKLVIMTGPVGPYYSKPVNLLTADFFVRAAYGGVGEAKAAGNYGSSLFPTKLAVEKGFDQVMWTDSKEHKYIQEVGTMNIFFVIDGKVITPATDGSVLKGVTRDSVIMLLRERGYMVEERRVSIDELIDAYKAGKLQEAFGTGTAAVVSIVSNITYKEFKMSLPSWESSKIASETKAKIEAIRFGTCQDIHNWIYKVPVKNTVWV